MAIGIYSYANLIDDAKRDAGSVNNIVRLANRSARFVVSDIDLRSTKRRAYLSPSLNEEQFDYQAPSDLKENAIVDIGRIEGRLRGDKFNLVTREYFDREKDNNANLIALEDYDFFRKLRISARVRGSDSDVTIHGCESLTDKRSAFYNTFQTLVRSFKIQLVLRISFHY